MFTLIAWTAVTVIWGLALWLSLDQRRRSRAHTELLTAALPAVGRVLFLEERYTENRVESTDLPTYFPVVNFTTAQGEQVRATVLIGARPAPARAGEDIHLRYDPADPQRVVMATGMASAATMGCFGTLFAAAFWVLGGLVVLVWAFLKLLLRVPI